MYKNCHKNQNTTRQEQLISFIIQALSRLGERELDLVARFIKTISE